MKKKNNKTNKPQTLLDFERKVTRRYFTAALALMLCLVMALASCRSV